MGEVQKYKAKQPIKHKKKKSIGFHHSVCTTLWFSKGWCKASNHSCLICPASSGISDGLVGANFSQNHDLLLEEKYCWVPWSQLHWEMELIWHFVGFVLAAVHRSLSAWSSSKKKDLGKAPRSFLYERAQKWDFFILMAAEDKNMRWMGTTWGERFYGAGVRATPHFRIAVTQKSTMKHSLTSSCETD